MTVQSSPNLMGIHHAFAQAEYGQDLAARVRYERYMPEGVTKESRQALLGPNRA